ncbi:unnamed protein product, partial [marine sediment metagenome]
MKNNKIYSVGFVLILCFSFVLQGDIIIINEQYEKDNSNVLSPLTASNSVELGWYRTWGGGAIIGWKDLNQNTTIYAQKINAEGEVFWGKNGKKIAEPGFLYYQYDLQICSDNIGGAFLSWVEAGPYQPITKFIVRHINSKGRLNWFNNGLLVRNLYGSPNDPQLCSDAYGNALLTWRDYRMDEYDIYA